MCFDRDALPPDPARTGMLADSEATVLVADDGNHLAATLARTVEPASAGVVIIPDVRGLSQYYERLAEHLADAGVHAVAIDPYGRTAGAEHREDGFDYGPHRAAVRDVGVRADVRAAAAMLRGGGATRALSMGFCFGGRASLMQASQEGIDGVIAFYGPPTQRVEEGVSALDEAGVEHRIVVYPDAPHSFFDRTMSEHAEICRDAWAAVLGFIDSILR